MRHAGRPPKNVTVADKVIIGTIPQSIELRIKLIEDMANRHTKLLETRNAPGLMVLAAEYRQLGAKNTAERLMIQARTL